MERLTNRAVLAEEKNRLYEKQIEILQGWLAEKTDVNTLLKSQKADLSNANQERAGARQIDLERIADRDALIAKQDAEIARLRNPGFLASLFDKRTVYGAVGGYGVCRLVTSGASATTIIGIPTLNQSGSQSQFSLFQTTADQRARLALKAAHVIAQ